MKPDYKNWVPKNMLYLLAFLATLSYVTTFFLQQRLQTGTIKNILCLLFLIIAIILSAVFAWMMRMYRAFSYKGKRKLSKDIIEGLAKYVEVPENGLALDVGCGSGALTIAVAKKNPTAKIIGVDRWGKEYSSFSKKLCEGNAKAEGVCNVEFAKGDATKLDYPDESFDAVTSNYVYHNITKMNRQELLLKTLRLLKKGGTFAVHDIFSTGKYGDMQSFIKKLKDMGYENVQLINTTNGIFMTKKEAVKYALKHSAILCGKK
ncbi:class I SAM-dependent methyltransferase [Treponema phagedenis]|uniref:Methylase involved in ubiquinone/menaquinone biosynthesis n=2 Tax=Treponema phagedenis TaxID=162 RepID=A0A0B7GXK5_TREPH|nr:class I SAM-dependent methyltransferase [Treponema phagedenis]QEJ94966.1 class I SAM-dependent methyltransferase [Treponema phagedenis]QEK03815.1 class I SAM-dependent methyltransferase [Treponema phagedenis]QEK09430.1 class I SAM-dependent methyltransferase [Treponema phagedenis]QSH96110.1 class I SAM-dependent methyltransferase [Treponema phagedenis]CEM63404.1 Methylase involved in ubiquinone/menaquinone biosynthesis [Treponema phagedenis]